MNNATKDNATPATVSTSKGKANDEEMGVGGSGGLGRQNTITQRSAGTVLPTSRSTPPANANMCAKTGAFASPPSRVLSHTAPAVACPPQAAGNDQTWAQHQCTCVCSSTAHNLHLARTLVPPRRALRLSSDQCLLLLRQDPVRSWHSLSLMLTVMRPSRRRIRMSRTTQRIFLCSRQLSRDHRDPGRACRQGRPRQQERTERRRRG